MHDGQRRRARREGEQHRSVGALGRRASARDRVAGRVVDQRIHRDDVVECAERGVEHVADAKLDAAGAEVAGRRSRASPIRVGERSIATTCGAAPRRLDRERAGAAAGVEHARAAQVLRQPATAACRASRRGRRARWRGCGRPARPTSAAPRPRPRCGRSRFQAGAAARVVGRSRSASVEPQQIEDVAVLQRLAASGSVPAQSWRRGACIRSAPPRAPASRSISNSVDFFRRRAADHVEVGEMRERLQAGARR